MNTNQMSETGKDMGARNCALALGITFLALGIAGFIPAFMSLPSDGEHIVPPATVPSLYGLDYGYLFGLFPTNFVHNLAHLVVGFAGIIAYPNSKGSRVYCRVFAYLYAVLAILGLIPFARTLFGLMPIFGNNVWFNGLTAATAAYFGFVKPASEMNDVASSRP
jgi:hypothetical protein